MPERVQRLLDGEDLGRKEGETVLLLTSADGAHPRVAMLSVGEVYAPDAREIRLALWPGSATTSNLRATGRATAFLVLDGITHVCELAVRPLPDLAAHGLAAFTATVLSVRSDQVGYAEVTGGVRFRLRDPATVRRWEAVIAALRVAAPAEIPPS